MGDGSSGSGANMKDSKGVSVNINDERRPSATVVRAFTDSKITAVDAFPELRGQIYNELDKITQARFSGRGSSGITGIYSASDKKIVIASNLPSSQIKQVVTHELGHALGVTSPPGFKSDVAAFNSAFSEYRRANPQATNTSFASKISNYATTAKSEAFAEAFSDYVRNGSNAAAESKLIMKHWRE